MNYIGYKVYYLLAVLKSTLIAKRVELYEHGLATCAAIFSRSATFLIALINTQYLNADDFGVFSILLLIANIINAMVSCGGDMWLNRFTRSYHTHKKQAPLISRYYLQISIGLVFLVFSIASGMYFFDCFESQKYAVVFFYSLIWATSGGLIETILAILRTTSGIKFFFFTRDFFMPLILIFSIFIFKLHSLAHFFKMAAFIWGTVLFGLLVYIFSFSKLYLPKTSQLNWSKLRKGLLSYTIKLIFNNFSARIGNGFDSLILAYYLPVNLVGKYRLGTQFSNAFKIVQHFVFLALPWHLRIGNDSKIQAGANVVQSRNQILIITALIALIILLLLLNPLLNLLGQDYSVISTPIFAFLLIRFSELLWGPQHEILISNNEISLDTLTNAFGLLVGATSFLIMIYFYDPMTSGVVSAGLNSLVTQFSKYRALKGKMSKSDNNSPRYLPWMSLLLTISGISYVVLH